MNAFGAQVTIPNADVKVWIIAPIMRAISFLGDETKFLATSHRSFIAMQHSMTLLAVARQFAIEKGAAQHGIEKIGELMRHTKGVDDWANEVVSSDFATPNMHSLIASWGAIEVAVEDTFVLTLLKRPDVAVQFKTKSDTDPLDEDSARRAFRQSERKARNNRTVGECYIALLHAIDIPMASTPGTLRGLAEINAIRNCNLHRSSVIDAKAVTEPPTLASWLDKVFVVSSQSYSDYFGVMGDFAQDILRGIYASEYMAEFLLQKA